MAEQEGVGFLSLDKREDQLVLAVFVLVLLSFYFGLQPGLLFAVIWAGTGTGALVCIYFALPNMWSYSVLLYAIYGISAFGVVLIRFWTDALDFFGISIPVLVGIFFIVAAFYIAFYIVNQIKKTRDASAKKETYLLLGFWSVSVILFFVFSVISIFSWSLWVDSGELQFYLILEPLLAILLVYILWLPDRNIDWSVEHLPKSPATRFISDKSKVLKKRMMKARNVCPECGSKLKLEKKACPSCDNTQTFGWCVTSEAYVLPCSSCGEMALYGKEKCDKCDKVLSDSIVCNSCKKAFGVKEWVVKNA
ncbi:MAG: hypothetical protein V3U20_09510 [Thermoplasmata archaeon]